MFSTKNIHRFDVRYIIWLGLASLIFAFSVPVGAFAQAVDMRAATNTDIRDRNSSALSEGLGGSTEDVEGLRSSIDDSVMRVRQNALVSNDEEERRAEEIGFERLNENEGRDTRDDGFRGAVSSSARARDLDGSLRAQHRATELPRTRSQDGDLGALIVDDVSGTVDGYGSQEDRIVRDQDGFLEVIRGGQSLEPDAAPSGTLPFPQPVDDGGQPIEGDIDPAGGSARDSRLNPYEPVGISAGSFRIFPEVTVSGAYMDNVRQSSGARDSDVGLELRPSIRATSNWRRHALEGDVSALGSFHNEFDSEDDREFVSNLRGRIDITRRTNIEGEAGYEFAQQSRGSADSPGGALESPDVKTLRGALAVNHRFNRLSMRLRGEAFETSHDDADLIGGGTSDESDQDVVVSRLLLRGSYELSPALSIFSEGLVERRDFETVSNGDGLSRDSDAFGLRAGILFDNGSKLYGEVAVGVIQLSPDDQSLDEFDGVTFDAEVSWRPSQLTTFSLLASTTINATTVVGSPGALTHAANFRVQHELLRHFILSAGVGLDHVDYQGSTLVERTYQADLGAEYIFNREMALIGAYQYEFFDTNSPNSNYTSNQLRLGLRFRR